MALRSGTVKTAGKMQMRASFVPDTFKATKRTVTISFASETPVLMGWYSRYYEILSFQDDHCDLSRLNNGAALLDNHDRWSGASKQPGVVERAWIENNTGYAEVRFANDEDGEKLMNKVKDGIVRNVSVGYNVAKYQEVESAGTQSSGTADENKIPTYRAVSWVPFEISFVPVPADHTVGVRSAGEQPPTETDVETLFLNEDTMRTIRLHRDTAATDNGGGAQPGQQAAAAPASGGENNRSTPAGSEEPPSGAQQRSQGGTQGAAPAAAAQAAAPAQQADTRSFSARFLEAAQAANLDIATMRSIETQANSDMARASELIFQHMAERNQGTQSHSANRHQDTDQRAIARMQGMENALLHRAAPQLFPDLSDAGREYRSYDLMEMGRSYLRELNISEVGMSRADLARAAMGQHSDVRAALYRGAMSSSDFPNILANVITKILRANYAIQQSQWKQLCRQRNVADFKAISMVQLSEAGDFEQVLEGGEYKRTKFTETGDTHRVKKYGQIIPFTWEMLINDDINAFGDLSLKVSAAMSRKEADLFWDLLLGGAGNLGSVMGYDNKQLFHADHNNTASAAAIDADSIGLMRKLLRKQKGIDGKTHLNITPKYLIVGADNEQKALQYTSSNFVPAKQSDENPWKNSVVPIVESRYDDYDANAWHLCADPAASETAIYSYLEGEGGMMTERRAGFDVDGVEVKARMVIGVKITEHRAWARNAGA